MTATALAQMLIFAAVLVTAAYLLGAWMARVYTARRAGPVERAFLRLVGSDGASQTWRAYAGAMLVFSAVSIGVLLLLLLAQGALPFNPNDKPGAPGFLAAHTAVSYVTSTNWQFYAGESTMSNGLQMGGLAVQNFAAPAVGLAVLVATTRGLTQRRAQTLGNFWVDVYRSLVFVIAPLAVVGALLIGGAGSGMLSMLLRILLAVFIGGLMIGRTPELLGKRIGTLQIKLVALGVLTVPVIALALTATSIGTEAGKESIFNPGAHGFTETLYAFTSQANNNGSAFAGFGYSELQAVLGMIGMLAGRFVPLLVMLALAGSLVSTAVTPPTRGTLRIDTPTFAVLLLAVVVITSGLTLAPALFLGPLAEGL